MSLHPAFELTRDETIAEVNSRARNRIRDPGSTAPAEPLDKSGGYVIGPH